MKIYVTKSFLPPREEYYNHLDDIFATAYVTNQGVKVRQLEAELRTYLNVRHIQCVANGTLALQMALQALEIEDGEVITTPFSYVASVSAVLWQKCTPVFVDIEPGHFTIDPDKIEEKITPQTKAILPVHVFGYACDVEKIEHIAERRNLKVIYDGSHAFAAQYKDRSLLTFGDISTCSFHATKPFHTFEGGACIIRDDSVADKIELIKRFGHQYDNHCCLGINAKMSEVHAAMGLANMPYINELLEKRRSLSRLYDRLLGGAVQRPPAQQGLEYNHSYYVVLFENETILLRAFEALNLEDIYPRRYFYPSLNTLPYLKQRQYCPVSEDIASRVACLPLSFSLTEEDIDRITAPIKRSV